MYNKNVRYESDYYLTESNPMTIISAVYCKDGLIIASDSKATSKDNGTKILNVPKIFENSDINSKDIIFSFAGAGEPAYFLFALEEIKKEYLKTWELEKFKLLCESSTNKIGERYLVKRLKELDIKINPFDILMLCEKMNFSCIIGAHSKSDERLGLFYVSSNGTVVPIITHKSIGTGKLLAEYILSRAWNFNDDSPCIKDIVNPLLFAIEEVKSIDNKCGGKTQLSILTKDGFKSEAELKNYLENFKDTNINIKFVNGKEKNK